MKIFDFAVTEVASFLGILVIIASIISWFVRVVVVKPLQLSFQELNRNLIRLSADISNLQKDNKNIYKLIEDVEKEVASKGVMFEQQIKTLFERVRIIEQK